MAVPPEADTKPESPGENGPFALDVGAPAHRHPRATLEVMQTH